MRKLTALCVLSLAVAVQACTVLRVHSQKEFDELGNNIIALAESGAEKIYVKLSSGTYVASDGQICLNGIDRPDLTIRIEGNSASIVPDGREYRNGDLYQGYFDANRSWMSGDKDIPVWSEVKYADGLIEILSVEDKYCRLKSRQSLQDEKDNPQSYILIPHWYRSSIYKIDKIEDSFVYFTASDLAKSYGKGYNVNDDYNYGKKGIRFKLCNVERGKGCLSISDSIVYLPEGVESVREGNAFRFVEIRNCKLGSLSLSGLSFLGSCYRNYSSSVITITNSSFDSAAVSACTFAGLRSHAIHISSSSNVSVVDCIFHDCYYDGVNSENKSLNTRVVGNKFRSMGKRMENSFCVICRGENYYVADNEMIDYGYGGIGVGVWYKHEKISPCNGIVENNTLMFTQAYISAINNYGIMDSGSIYVWTQNDGAVIRNNHIDGFAGMKDNRGIFCDDGASDFTIENNIVTGVQNSFSIDSRRVSSVESESGSKVSRANVNNRVSGNLVDSPIRFEPREGDDNGCYFGENTVKQL